MGIKKFFQMHPNGVNIMDETWRRFPSLIEVCVNWSNPLNFNLRIILQTWWINALDMLFWKKIYFFFGLALKMKVFCITNSLLLFIKILKEEFHYILKANNYNGMVLFPFLDNKKYITRKRYLKVFLDDKIIQLSISRSLLPYSFTRL